MSIYNDASLIFYPSGYKESKLYSLKPTDGSGDLTFTRASSATRVNAEGLIETASILGSELIVNGDFANELTDWTENGGSYATIVSGALNSNNPDAGNWYAENISQNVSFVNGTTYKLTFKAKNISGNLNLRITQGANPMASLDLTSTFVDYTYFYTANADNGSIRIFCNSAVGQFQIDDISVKEVITNNIPRIDYTGGGCGKLLLEPQRTNLLLQSNNFTTYWNLGANVALTANFATSPDGTTNASRLLTSGTAQNVFQTGVVTVSGSVYTVSIYAKNTIAGTSQKLRFGSFVNGYSQYTLTDDWVRYTHTFTSTATSQIIGINSPSPTENFDILTYQFQCELGSYATSAIPTTSTAVTRVRDSASKTPISSFLNTANPFTFYLNFQRAEGTTPASYQLIGLDNGGYGEYIKLINKSAQLKFYIQIRNSTTSATSADITNTPNIKIAIVYDGATSYKIFHNGALLQTLTLGACSLNRFASGENGIQFTTESYQSIMIFPTALSDDDLTLLTGTLGETYFESYALMANYLNYTIQ